MGNEGRNKHWNNTYFYKNAKHPMNKWREIKCLVLDKGNDMLHTCRTF